MPVLASASVRHLFLFELLAPLLAGGTAVLYPACIRRSIWLCWPAELQPARRCCTRCRRGDAAVDRERAVADGVECPRLRQVFVGGDAVSAELLELIRRAFPRSRLTVLYGPTEGTILASCDEDLPAK